MDNKRVVLIIDDEIQIRRFLKISLEAEGYKIHEAENANSGLIKAASVKPELILLDLGLPDEDGLSVLKKIRGWTDIPIIIISVRNSENDIVSALDSGANDYLTKPFNTNELNARIRAALRNVHTEEASPVFKIKSIEIDYNTRIVLKDGNPVKLTATEYSLLTLFIRNAGKVLTHGYILKEIWGLPFSEETQYVRIYISQLRKKLEDDPEHPQIFITESGVGYRLKID
jgi:two-component system KDP operon response regulator KdpE